MTQDHTARQPTVVRFPAYVAYGQSELLDIGSSASAKYHISFILS